MKNWLIWLKELFRENDLFTLLVMIEMLSSRLKCIQGTHYGLAKKVCEALTCLLDSIYIKLGTNLYRQIVGIPMGTNCAYLVVDLFLFCSERDFIIHVPLSADKDAEIIETFNSTSRYVDDVLNIDNIYFDGMVNQIYPSELQLNKANSSDTGPRFWICI